MFYPNKHTGFRYNSRRIVEDLSMTEQARDTEALIRDQIAKH